MLFFVVLCALSVFGAPSTPTGAHAAWPLPYAGWPAAHAAWPLPYAGWPAAHAEWPLPYAGWPAAHA